MSTDCTRSRWLAAAFLAVGVPLAVMLAAVPVAAQTDTTPQFANGSVTSVHGSSIQVSNQTQNSESTVMLTPNTQITKRENATPSAITVGSCVRVTGTGSATKGIKATSVAISAATANGCAGPGGGAGPDGGRRFGGQGPRAFRNGNGRFPGGTRPANFAAAFGPVVSTSGDHVTVKSTMFSRQTTKNTKKGSKSKSTSSKPKTTTANVVVTIGSNAMITQTVAGSASDVNVGSCVTATGTTGAGGITATRLNVSQPVNGTCTLGGGFGFRGGGSNSPENGNGNSI